MRLAERYFYLAAVIERTVDWASIISPFDLGRIELPYYVVSKWVVIVGAIRSVAKQPGLGGGFRKCQPTACSDIALNLAVFAHFANGPIARARIDIVILRQSGRSTQYAG